MNWLDYILAAFLLFSLIQSARKGFAREVISLAAAVVALVLGMWFYGTAGVLFEPLTGPGRAASLLGFLLIVVAVLILGALAGSIVKRFLRAVGLSFFDRLLGALFGLIRAGLILTALLTAWISFGPHPSTHSTPSAVVNSRLAPYLLEASRVFVSIAPMDLKSGFRKQYEQVKASTLNRAGSTVRTKGSEE